MTATRLSAIGAPGYSETLPCTPESARLARRLVHDALESWNFTQLMDDGALIVTELVGNSVQHSKAHSLRISIGRNSNNRVRIAVSDRSRESPLMRTPNGDEESGRGLLLIEGVADRWDTEYRRWGKIVWAELLVEGSAR
ncbi:ATP-binding protein [Streptomyces nigrescens]